MIYIRKLWHELRIIVQSEKCIVYPKNDPRIVIQEWVGFLEVEDSGTVSTSMVVIQGVILICESHIVCQASAGFMDSFWPRLSLPSLSSH
jgi:hypothetical protein